MSTLSLQRSKQKLEEEGYKVWIVETWNGFIKQRRDLFNFADLIGIREDMVGVTAIQATGEDCQSHITKILTGYHTTDGKVIAPNPYIRIWLKSSNRFFIWAWRKRGDRGKRKTWQLREIEFLIENGEVVTRELQKPD
jgi:hypothetical protein